MGCTSKLAVKDKNKLRMWQDRLHHNEARWSEFTDKFEEREALVRKTNEVKACCDGDTARRTYHVRNICFELIESQVDTSIPMPKVTAKHKEHSHLAKIIEDMLRDELNRLPMELINDMTERTVPIQGGAFYLFEWDNSIQTQSTIGDLTAQFIHPKQIVPQDGVFDSVEDMDYIFLKLPQTKEYIKRRFGVDVSEEGEEEPEVRGVEGASPASDMVTQYVAYFRNDNGGVGKYSWVGDVELEDIEDYQARRLRKCSKCGALEPMGTEALDMPAEMGINPAGGEGNHEWMEGFDGSMQAKTIPDSGKGKCPYCGGKMEVAEEEFETVMLPKVSTNGVQIPPGARLPYYKPDIYPILMQKSVSTFGQLLGDSDIDQISDQQNTINRLWKKLLDMTLLNGSFATMPADSVVEINNNDMKVVRVKSPEKMQYFKTFDMQPKADTISTLYTLLNGAYEEARQAIGITDSFQGRRDETATSGKAKEFAAQQSAGRLESKRVMKEAAYQQIFESIFKFKLAYADEPRPIISHDEQGNEIYEVFDRYDFLAQDAAGQWYWLDDFIFDVDSSSPLAKDREALWQETRMNFQQGAYGDPAQPTTLAFFWGIMEELHYPLAGSAKKYAEKLVLQQQQMMQQQMMMQQQQMQMQQQAAMHESEMERVEAILSDGKKTKEKTANKSAS